MSYNLLGAKWGAATAGATGGQVTWAADLGSGLVYDTNLYSRADFEAALQDAFQTWEDVASIDFVMTTNISAADIVVDMGALAGSVVGQALITAVPLAGLDQIIDVDITIDSLEFWSPYGSGGTNFYAVATHEIGHAIGLDHVNDTSQIMNAFLGPTTLGNGDINGAQFLYGADPGDLSAAGPPPSSPLVPSGVPTPSPSSPSAPADDGGGGGGGGIVLLLAAIAALIAGLFSGGAAAPVVSSFAATRDPGDDPDDGTDPLEAAGEELMAFLDASFGEGPEPYQVLHEFHGDRAGWEEALHHAHA